MVTVFALQEALEAYKSQNQFLSSEIVELNAIRSDENEAIRASNRWVGLLASQQWVGGAASWPAMGGWDCLLAGQPVAGAKQQMGRSQATGGWGCSLA